MADSKRLRNSVKGLQRVKTWQLVIVFILFAFIAATFLRLNNIGMVERRAAVISADKSGDERILVNRLYDLQRYVTSHMNTDLGGGVGLEESYTRVYQKWLEEESNRGSALGNVYKKAQEVCEPQFSYYTVAYLQCTTNELEKYPSSQAAMEEGTSPNPKVFVHTFASPTWSPDFAGWSLVVCAFILALIFVRLVSLAILKLMLNRQYRRI